MGLVFYVGSFNRSLVFNEWVTKVSENVEPKDYYGLGLVLTPVEARAIADYCRENSQSYSWILHLDKKFEVIKG